MWVTWHSELSNISSPLTVEEVGCFYDKSVKRAFPTLVENLRPEINWHHLEKIIQKCALLSKQRNYEVRHLRIRRKLKRKIHRVSSKIKVPMCCSDPLSLPLEASTYLPLHLFCN